jgi:hypothetical protein
MRILTQQSHHKYQRKNRNLLSLFLIDLLHLSLFLSLFLIFGCGSMMKDQIQSDMTAKQIKQKKDCPEKAKYGAGFLLEKGEGASIEEATQRAHAEISRFISSEIQSLLVATSEMGSGQNQSKEELQEEIRLSSRFEHAELIQNIESCSLCDQGTCTVYAFLGTGDAAKRIKEDIQNDLSRLLKATSDLTTTTPLLRFSQAWQEAQGAYERIRPQFNQLEVLGALTADLKDAKETMRKAYQLKENRKAKIAIMLKPLNLEKFVGSQIDQVQATDLVNASLQSAMNKSLTQAGLKRWDRGECPANTDQAEVMLLAPRGDLICSLGAVGPQCILKLRANLSLCQNAALTDLGEVDWSQTPLNGVHSNDYQFAIQRLLKGLSEEKIKGPLMKALSNLVIL